VKELFMWTESITNGFNKISGDGFKRGCFRQKLHDNYKVTQF